MHPLLSLIGILFLFHLKVTANFITCKLYFILLFQFLLFFLYYLVILLIEKKTVVNLFLKVFHIYFTLMSPLCLCIFFDRVILLSKKTTKRIQTRIKKNGRQTNVTTGNTNKPFVIFVKEKYYVVKNILPLRHMSSSKVNTRHGLLETSQLIINLINFPAKT